MQGASCKKQPLRATESEVFLRCMVEFSSQYFLLIHNANYHTCYHDNQAITTNIESHQLSHKGEHRARSEKQTIFLLLNVFTFFIAIANR